MKKHFFVIALIIMLGGALCACGGPTPTETMETFLKAVQEKDTDTVEGVYAGDDFDMVEEADSESDEELDKELNEKLEKKLLDFDYEVSDEKIDGDNATVKVKLTTYDLGTAMTDFYNDYLDQGIDLAFSGGTDEQMTALANKIFAEKIDAMKKDHVQTVKVSMSKKDGKWVIDEFDDEGDFYNAIMGGMIDAEKNIDA